MTNLSAQWLSVLLTSALAVVLLTGIALWLYFRPSSRTTRWLRSADTCMVSSLKSSEQVKLVGTISRSAELQPDPLTRRPSVFFDLVVEEDIGTGGDTDWVERLHLTHRGEFVLSDHSGSISVSTKEATAFASDDSESDRKELAPEQRAVLSQLFPGFQSRKGERVRLRWLSLGLGDIVAVIGRTAETKYPQRDEQKSSHLCLLAQCVMMNAHAHAEP